MNTFIGYLTRVEYDLLKRANFSTAKHMARSPAHYLKSLLGPGPDTDTLIRGRATHLAVFEPERFQAECVVWDGKVRRGKKWDQFSWDNSDKEILTQGVLASALAIGTAARSSPMALPFLVDGMGEQSIQWTHVEPDMGGLPGFSIECKARLDYVRTTELVDLKTTADASPLAFGRATEKYQYHTQAAFYVDGYEAVTGSRLPYRIVAVESAPPHVVQVYRVNDDLLARGRDTYRQWLRQIHNCRRDDRYGGYHHEPLDLALPPWSQPREDDLTGLDLVFDSPEGNDNGLQ